MDLLLSPHQVQDAQATMRLYTLVKKQWEAEIKAKKSKTPEETNKRKPRCSLNKGRKFTGKWKESFWSDEVIVVQSNTDWNRVWTWQHFLKRIDHLENLSQPERENVVSQCLQVHKQCTHLWWFHWNWWSCDWTPWPVTYKDIIYLIIFSWFLSGQFLGCKCSAVGDRCEEHEMPAFFYMYCLMCPSVLRSSCSQSFLCRSSFHVFVLFKLGIICFQFFIFFEKYILILWWNVH